MRDLLLLSLQLKQQALASDWDVKYVLRRFEPLFSALFASEDLTDGTTVALLLAKCLQNMHTTGSGDNNIRDVAAKCMPQNDEDTGVITKSGALDKVSDDCLKLALDYLDFGDRCNAVERTCQRLFALSRAVPFHCEFFDEVWNERMHTNAVGRFDTDVLDFSRESHWGDEGYNFIHMPLALSFVERFRENVRCLRFGGEFDDADNEDEAAEDDYYEAVERICDENFPNLTEILLIISTRSLKTLLRKPSVHELYFFGRESDGVNSATFYELFRRISECKQLDTVSLTDVTNEDGSDELPVDANGMALNYSHVTDLYVTGTHEFLPQLVHDKMECLSVSATRTKHCGTKPSSLQRLCLTPSEATSFDNMRIFEPCHLESLEIAVRLEDIWRVYEHFAPSRLQVNVQRTDTDANLDESLERLKPYLLTDNGDAEVLHLKVERGLSKSLYPFFIWLTQFRGFIKTQIKLEIWELDWVFVLYDLEENVFETLKSIIDVEFL